MHSLALLERVTVWVFFAGHLCGCWHLYSCSCT